MKNRILQAGVLSLLVVFALFGWWVSRWINRPSPPRGDDPLVEAFVEDFPPDPRLDPNLVWENARPDVAYVGDSACQVCHAGICDTYHKGHPMAYSSSFAGKPDAAGRKGIEEFGPSNHTGFIQDQIRFSVSASGDGGYQQKEEYLDENGQVLAVRDFDYSIAIGSGQRGRSFLFDRNGWLFQTTMSWYSKDRIWDISPGFQIDRENYGRPIHRMCLYCHTNQASLVKGTANKYDKFQLANLGIGCERCHGPGKLHCDKHANDPGSLEDFAKAAKHWSQRKADKTIVNPPRLEPALREAVCYQCHLQGEKKVEKAGRSLDEFRPGLPLEAFVAVFVRHPGLGEKNKAVGQVEQMNSSACFKKSNGRLGCQSCHDPHSIPTPETRVDYFRDRCLACHKENLPTPVDQKPTAKKTDPAGGISPPCSLSPEHRLARRNDCAACHLPRRASSDIAHTSLSDHRILRAPTDIPAQAPGFKQGDSPLVPFPPRELKDPDRDLTLALAQLALDQPMAKSTLLASVGPRLDELTRRHPGDFPLWAIQAERLAMDNRNEESLRIWERLRAARPEDETTLLGCCLAAMRAGQKARAAELAKRLLRVAPENSGNLLLVGDTLKALGQYEEALSHLEAGVRSQPASTRLRKALVECLVRTGRTTQAREELETLAKLSRRGEGDLRRWFTRLLAESR